MRILKFILITLFFRVNTLYASSPSISSSYEEEEYYVALHTSSPLYEWAEEGGEESGTLVDSRVSRLNRQISGLDQQVRNFTQLVTSRSMSNLQTRSIQTKSTSDLPRSMSALQAMGDLQEKDKAIQDKDNIIQQRKREILDLQDQYEEAQERITENRETLRNAAVSFTKMQKEANELRISNRLSNNVIKSLFREKEDSEARRVAAERRIKELEATVASQVSSLASINSQLSRAQTQINFQSSTLSTLTSKVEKYESWSANLKKIFRADIIKNLNIPQGL